MIVKWPNLQNCKHDCKTCFAKCFYRREQNEEQKPAEWNEDYREEDLRTRFAFYTYKDEDGVLYLSNVFVEETSRNKGFGTKILAAAEKVAETIGAIKICLKVKQDSPANAWYRKHGYGYVAFEGDYDWLEKTLEYLKPKKSVEWSEEEERILDSLIRLYSREYSANAWPWADGVITYGGVVNFLNSLKSQPHLKPSEEQPEVDLEEEYETWWNSIMGKINIEHIMEWYMHETARHFYELGLKAKEGKK